MTHIRVTLYLLLSILLSCHSSKVNSNADQSTPNLVILLADDMGYGDLGCYGGPARTPNLDRLAQNGMRFTDFYAAAPNCSPSRAGLLTGRAPSKIGIYNYLPEGHPMHLKAEEITIAEVVKQQGYRTGHFGKWHLSCLPQDPVLQQPQPHDQGFDHSFGTANNAAPSHLNPVNFVRNGQPLGELEGYSCDLVVEEAIHWMDTLGNTPFLLYMAFHEPHKKVASPPELVANYDSYPTADAEYLANVENLDEAVGRLLSYLTKKELLDNTLILFASDNGSYRKGSNDPLLGGKSFVYEGGIRVPGMMYWHRRIAPGQVIPEPAGLIDFMPTICDLIGAAYPQPERLDGTSLLPLIDDQPLDRRQPLSWFFYRTSPEMAMRIGDYTILGRNLDSTRHTHFITRPDMDHIKNLTLDSFELYRLTDDIGQQNNLDYRSVEQGQAYRDLLTGRLKEIQNTGPYWDNLPMPSTTRKLKSEWRTLDPKGFSN